MKQIFILAIVLLSNAFAFANTNPTFITASNDKVFILNFGNATTADKSVKIMDESGNVVFTEKVKGNVSAKKYNLSKLTSGNYTFVVENAQKIMNQSVNISNKGVDVLPEVNEMFKPSLNSNGNIWTLNALVFGKETQVEMYDAVGSKLINETFTGKPTINRAYNVEKLNKGEYFVNVTVGEKSFSYTMTK